MSEDSGNEYTCACCGKTSAKGWSDEEARKEKETLFPSVPWDEMTLVCQDCFDRLRDYEAHLEYRIGNLELMEGDTIVIKATKSVPVEAVQRIIATIASVVGPGHKIIVLDKDLDLEILRAEASHARH